MGEQETKNKEVSRLLLALAPTATCVPTLFVILMTFSSYVAVGVYGATTVLAGTIITGTRMFDAITDPIIGVMSDRFTSKFGRIRSIMILGYIITSIAVITMFKLGLGGGENRVWVITTMLY